MRKSLFGLPTRDRRVAAALSTLGVPVEIRRIYDDRSSTEKAFYYFETNPVGAWTSNLTPRQILGKWQSGELEKVAPAHPFLTGIRALVCRDRILDLSNKGTRIRLVSFANGAVWHYVEDPAATLAGVAAGVNVLRVSDLKVAASLAVCGFPILHVRGNHPSFEWFLPPIGPAGEDGLALIRRLRGTKLATDAMHPFFVAHDALRNNERLLDAVNRVPRKIHVHDPNHPTRGAIITEHAPKQEWDRVSQFLNE